MVATVVQAYTSKGQECPHGSCDGANKAEGEEDDFANDATRGELGTEEFQVWQERDGGKEGQ
jgi:hypothetical protein